MDSRLLQRAPAVTKRHVVLPARGVLLVSTDVHGNLADILRLEEIFAEEAAAPGRVHFVLGNHDHGHVGGPHTAKFHADEVAALESGLSEAQRGRLRGRFERAMLAAAAPCGVLMTHGSPDSTLSRLEDLDAVPLELKAMSLAQTRMLRALLTSYGQPKEECRAMLENVSRTSGLDLRVVVHGHDRDELGFFREGGNQVCPVIFGAARPDKRYVRLDLGARYDDADALRDGIEILRLHS